MISPELTSLAVNGNQPDPLLLEIVRTLGQFSLPVGVAVIYLQLINKQFEIKNDATEKQIAANKEATEKQIAANKEATEKQIAATDKKIEADIKVTREITREVINAADSRF